LEVFLYTKTKNTKRGGFINR